MFGGAASGRTGRRGHQREASRPPAGRPHLGPPGAYPISIPDSPSDDIDPRRERVRFLGAEVERAPASELRVRVRLAVRGDDFVAETRGTGAGVVELRLAVEATLSALEEAVPRAPRFQMVGVKSVRAFDAEAVMVGLRTAPPDERHLMGCVRVGASPARAAATATLDAVNRVLGRPYLDDV